MSSSVESQLIDKLGTQFCFLWHETFKNKSLSAEVFANWRRYREDPFGHWAGAGGNASSRCTLNIMERPDAVIKTVDANGQIEEYICFLYFGIIKYIARLSGCAISFTLTTGARGGNRQPADGKWSGYYEHLHNRSTDLYLLPSTFKMERLEIMEFGYLIPSGYTLSMLTSSHHQIVDGLDQLFDVFEAPTWVLIAAVYVCCSLVKMLAQRMRAYRRRPSADRKHFVDVDYGQTALYFFKSLLGAGDKAPKRLDGPDQLITVWLLGTFVLRFMFLGHSQSMLVTKSTLRVDSFEQLLEHLNKYNVYVEAESSVKDILLAKYPQLLDKLYNVHYMFMFDALFMNNFCHPRELSQNQTKYLNALAASGQGAAARKKQRKKRRRLKLSSALVANENNIDQLYRYYHTFGLHKAEHSAALWYANFPLRKGLPPMLKAKLEKFFHYLYMFGIHEKIRTDEIYLQKFKFYHTQLYHRHRLLQQQQRANRLGNALHRLNQYRELLQENFFQLSVPKRGNRQPTSGGPVREALPEEEEGDQGDISIEHIYPHILLFLINCALSCCVFIGEVIYFVVDQVYIRPKKITTSVPLSATL